MQADSITKVWEQAGKLYGRTDPGVPFQIYNLQRTSESISTYDFSKVIEGRELVQQYIRTGEKDES